MSRDITLNNKLLCCQSCRSMKKAVNSIIVENMFNILYDYATISSNLVHDVSNFRYFLLVWDATAKASTGVLRGNVFQMGHFEQCITAQAPYETQYCLATITMQVPKLQKINRDHLATDFDAWDSVLDRLYVSKYVLVFYFI